MSKELKKGEGRVFEAWSTTDCDECGQDFQVTRSVSKTVFCPVVCHDCKDYKKAYEEGVESVKSQLDAQSAYIEELRAALIECHNAHEDYYIGCDQVHRIINNQSPAASLEQVKREAIIEAANSLCVKGESVHPARYTAFIEYANNLNEKGL